MMRVAKQIWRVYTAEGRQVVSTLWNQGGPQSATRKVIGTYPDEEKAFEEATLMQREYDRVRTGLSA